MPEVISQLKFVVRLPAVNGVDIDEAENSWYYSFPGTGTPTYANLCADLIAFYNGGSTSVASWLSPVLDRGADKASVTIYVVGGHLDGSATGVGPAHFETFTLAGSATGNSEPLQIAMVAEYEASMSGLVEFGVHSRPRARRRGRHYFGPIRDQGWNTAGSPTFNPSFIASQTTSLIAAYVALLASTNFGPGWSVWSRKDAGMFPVIGGHVDTTLRTRRSRVIPQARILWP